MSGWRGSRLGGGGGGVGGGGSPTSDRIPSSRTVRLGKVQPQAPGHRTVFCNDREANALTKFKVLIIIWFSFIMLQFCLLSSLLSFGFILVLSDAMEWAVVMCIVYWNLI